MGPLLKILGVLIFGTSLLGLVSGAGFPSDPTRDQPDDRYRGDGDIQGGQVPVKNASAVLLENLIINPLNFSRTSEDIIDETGGQEFCFLTPERGQRCRGHRTRRWYFSQRKSQCKKFRYRGCGGNANNFRSKRECERACADGGRANTYYGINSGSSEDDYVERRGHRRRGHRRRFGPPSKPPSPWSSRGESYDDYESDRDY